LITVDSSAVIAILQSEPLAHALRESVQQADRVLMSAASYVETGAVLSARWRGVPEEAVQALDAFCRASDIEVVPLGEAQARVALQARIRFGRGTGHPARLNLGDLFSYALAKTRNAPLLFVGRDFAATDITPALDLR
jgi:ribonuclease VapC